MTLNEKFERPNETTGNKRRQKSIQKQKRNN